MRTTQTMIEQEVLVCVSSLVSTLAKAQGELRFVASPGFNLFNLTEQAMELASPVLDYEEAAREAGWTIRDKQFWDGSRVSHPAVDEGWQALCDWQGIDAHEREVFEHYAVTDWFAEKLEAAGEKVDRDFAGMAVWARTTSGQMIAADAVIERIYAETHRAEG